MKKHLNLLLIPALFLAVIVVLSGCQSIFGGDDDSERTSTVTITADSDDEFELEDDTDGPDTEQLAEGFPTDIPIFEAADLQSSDRTENSTRIKYEAVYISDEDFESVKKFYEEKMIENGWQVTNKDNVNNDGMDKYIEMYMETKKGTDRIASVRVTEKDNDPGKVRIVIVEETEL